MKKRGISDIIVIVILVALVLAAIAVFWFVIRNIISEGTRGAGLGRFTINLKITNAYESSGKIIVRVKRNPGEGDLVAIKFILVNNTDSEVITQDTDLEVLDEKTFTLSPTKLNSLSIVSVSIAPVFLSASGERIIGDIVDTYYLKAKTGEETGNGVGNGNGDEGYCGDGICNTTAGENTGNCPDDCVSEGGEWCGNEICNATAGEDETTCPSDCGPSPCISKCADLGLECGYDPACGQLCGTCGAGEVCDEKQQCVPDLIVSGIIDSVWPIAAPMYFDSEQLPKDYFEAGYLVGRYVNFSNPLEIGCIQIYNAEYLSEYDKTHVELERVANIASGDGFTIYHSTNCGGAI